MDIWLLFSLLSGFDKEEIVVGEQAMIAMMKTTMSSSSSSSIPGEYCHVLLQHLEDRFFLPPYFSNTTIGAIAVKTMIENGSSRILNHLLHHPTIQLILKKNANDAIISDESIANKTIDNYDDEHGGNDEYSNSSTSLEEIISFANAYNLIKSSNSIFIINHLLQSNYFVLQLLQPCYCGQGWSELIRHLSIFPSPFTKLAYESMISDQDEQPTNLTPSNNNNNNNSNNNSNNNNNNNWKSTIFTTLTKSQYLLMQPKQQFLHHYYLEQLQSEITMLLHLVNQYSNYLNDDYSIEDWLQGLIELENISSSFLLHAQLLVHECVEQAYNNNEMNEFSASAYQRK